jgi:hypothetical protein
MDLTQFGNKAMIFGDCMMISDNPFPMMLLAKKKQHIFGLVPFQLLCRFAHIHMFV